MEVIFWILFFEFHDFRWFRFPSWDSPISSSLFFYYYLPVEFEFRGKGGVGKVKMAAEFSSLATFLLSSFLRCHLPFERF